MKTYQAKDFEIELHAEKLRWSTSLFAWKTIRFDDIVRVYLSGSTLTIHVNEQAHPFTFNTEDEMREFQWALARQAIAA
jgi:hypothetical protein